MKILIYTFKTFPYIEELNSISKDIVILKKLKTDIYTLEERITNEKFEYIIGFAKGNKKSTFETQGVNIFNKGKILAEGKGSYPLYFPKQGFENIKVNYGYTTSFCNWGIYMVSQIIYQLNIVLFIC